MPEMCPKLKLMLFRCSDISSWPLGTAQDVIRDDELTPTPYNQRVFIPSKSQHGSLGLWSLTQSSCICIGRDEVTTSLFPLVLQVME